ncbi:hypothetical protein [Achromobacter ruhlandii]|uniref:hypothetical protein n=1 Tax=Achromobacter ruhlandii TaxID=72557 RepID=UPI003BA1E88F
MRELTLRDCELVSGGVGPVGAAIGAATGAATYIGNAIGTGTGSMAGFVNSTVAGALTGFIAGPVGATAMRTAAGAVLFPQLGFYTGMGGGLIERGMSGTDYSGTNYN